VFAGNYYTCAVSTNDTSYCWGFGLDGQLGNAARVSRNAPNWPVTNADSILGPYPNFRTISGGPSHACGITITSSLNCWGFSPDGRAFITPGSPFAIPTSPAVASVRFLATGESFSCYVTAGGLAVCSGTNELFEVTGVNNIPPVTGYSTIAAGLRHGCGMPRLNPANLTASRTPRCWGENNNGQLGRDTATFLPSPAAVPVTMPAGVTFDSLSLVAGAAHTCALASADGANPRVAYCWGSNAFGQLGNGAAIAQGGRSPVPVSTGFAFARLYGGDFHTCGLTTAGVAFCWGRNTSGQLGNGGTVSSSTPVQVGGGVTFSALALGELHTCGVSGSGPVIGGTTTLPGVVFCWGDNEKGQLGLGTFGANGVPVLVPTRVAFQQ
jgi:alpha-tubulin suppressor-like RCC1 family protein